MAYSLKPVPKGAWDTHNHIFEQKRFPFAPGRHFTPSVVTLEDLRDFEASIGVDHVCIAHGLSHGADCTSLIYYLGQYKGEARGICVLHNDIVTDTQLDEYHTARIRSVRLDFFKAKAMQDLKKQVAMINSTAARLLTWREGGKSWSIQIQQPNLSHWKELRVVANNLGVPLVLDHMGLVKAISMSSASSPLVTDTPEWQNLLGALRDGNLWVKISAPYRNSRDEPNFEDLERIVVDLVHANPHWMIWGSDWPHTQRHEDRQPELAGSAEPFLKVDNWNWIRSLSTWLNEEEWQALWVDNPQKLYDYNGQLCIFFMLEPSTRIHQQVSTQFWKRPYEVCMTLGYVDTTTLTPSHMIGTC